MHCCLFLRVRFAETLPTDPKALQVFHDIQRRLGSAKGTARATGGSERPSTATRASLSSERPVTASHVAASTRTERFSSASLRTVQSMGLTYRPAVVTGFSAPEEEVALPHGGEAFRYSRLGQTSLSRLQDRLKLPGYPSRPFSAPVQMQAYGSAPDWQQDSSPPLSQPASATAPAEHLAAQYARVQRLSVLLPGSEDLSAAGGHMPTVAEEATATQESAAFAEPLALPTLPKTAPPGGQQDAASPSAEAAAETGSVVPAELHQVPDPCLANEDVGTVCKAVEGEQPEAAAQHGSVGIAAPPGTHADAGPAPDQEDATAVALDDSEDSGFVKEDGDAGSEAEDEVEQAIARVSRMGAQRSSHTMGSMKEHIPHDSGAGTAPEGQGEAVQVAREAAGQEEQADEDGWLQQDAERSASESSSIPQRSVESGNALQLLHGGLAEVAHDTDMQERMQLLLADGADGGDTSAMAAAATAQQLEASAADEDTGIEEDQGEEGGDSFDSPQALSSAGSGLRPASGLRPTSARPTSARPASGRPTSARPSSGRPSSGRPGSGNSQAGLTASPGGSGLGRIASIPEH